MTQYVYIVILVLLRHLHDIVSHMDCISDLKQTEYEVFCYYQSALLLQYCQCVAASAVM